MKLQKNSYRRIILHCSVSKYGNVDLIRGWHKNRKFDDIGYHIVIENGFPDYLDYKENNFIDSRDGRVCEGRDLKYIGAHCKGHNSNSIGICLIGDQHFTWNQILSLFRLLKKLRDGNAVSYFTTETKNLKDVILGHYEVDKHGKTCPNIEMNTLRTAIKLYLDK